MSMAMRFRESPTAGDLAGSLGVIDRETRRIATSMAYGQDLDELRGRGIRLLAKRDGVIVREAVPGSLDIAFLLGGLYSIVTGGPFSFAINLAALLGYSRLAVRAVFPCERKEDITVDLADGDYDGITVHSPKHGTIAVRGRTPLLRVKVSTEDGVEIEFEGSNGLGHLDL